MRRAVPLFLSLLIHGAVFLALYGPLVPPSEIRTISVRFEAAPPAEEKLHTPLTPAPDPVSVPASKQNPSKAEPKQAPDKSERPPQTPKTPTKKTKAASAGNLKAHAAEKKTPPMPPCSDAKAESKSKEVPAAPARPASHGDFGNSKDTEGMKGILAEKDVTVLYRAEPEYPLLSRKRKEEGEVTVLLTVASGKTLRVEVEISSGHPRLDEAAKKALSRWEFSEEISGTIRIPVIFSLMR